MLHADPYVNIISWSNMVRGKFKPCLWDSVFFVMVWSLWYKRNQIKFDNNKFYVPILSSKITKRVSEWIEVYAPKFLYSQMQVQENIIVVWDWKYKNKCYV